MSGRLARRVGNRNATPLLGSRPEWYSTAVVFSIEIEREADGRWIAEVPDLSGVMCYGADRDENDARAQETEA